MTESSVLHCTTCSQQFNDLKSLLNHMSSHTLKSSSISTASCTTSPKTSAIASSGNCKNVQRQIVLSHSAFRQLQPYLQQKNAPSVRVILSTGKNAASSGKKAAASYPDTVSQHSTSALSHKTGNDRILRQQTSTAEDRREQANGPEEEPDDDLSKCRLCHRKFKHKLSLVAHCRQHVMSRTCGLCGKKTRSDQLLMDHLESHVDRRMAAFQCDQCEKSFVHAKSLYVHKRNHTGAKPYVCQYCGKAFRHWHKRQVHVRIHTGERPYVCEVCGWGFPRNDEKKRHMKTHQGKKMFHCSDCGVGCANQLSLIYHMNIHHKEKGASNADIPSSNDDPTNFIPVIDTNSATNSPGSLSPNSPPNVDTVLADQDSNTENEITTAQSEFTFDDRSYAPQDRFVSKYEGMGDGLTIKQENFDEDDEENVNENLKKENFCHAGTSPQKNLYESGHVMPKIEVKLEPEDKTEQESHYMAETAQCKEDWSSEDELDLRTIEAHLLEPKIQLIELAVDIVRMRDVIRNKLALNNSNIDSDVRCRAEEFANGSTPDFNIIKSMLKKKLNEGHVLSRMLDEQMSEA